MARLLLVVLLFGVLALAAKKEVPWETGRVVSQDLSTQNGGTYAAPAGRGVIAVPIYQTSNIVVVDAGQLRYKWLELRNRHPLILTVNADVQFYRDKNLFVVLDSGGGRHKFSLIGSTQMPSPAQ